MSKLKSHVFLMGFMGTGKSTIAKELSKKLGVASVDLDKEVEVRCGKSIKEIFAEKGEAFFREMEREALFGIKEKKVCIVACGGGVVLNPENRKFIKSVGVRVVLEGSPETIHARLEHDKRRPLVAGEKTTNDIKAMMESRRHMYEDVADIKILIDGKNPRQICEEIISELSIVSAYR